MVTDFVNEAIPIVKCKSRPGEQLEFEVDIKALKNVFNQPEVADNPIALYSIAGKRRGGKSFLLNLLLYYDAAGKVNLLNMFEVSNTHFLA